MARPSKFLPEYCEKLILHMKDGYSFASFGSTISVCKDTLYDWVKIYPDFSDAKKIGESHSLYYWESLGLKAARGEIQGFNASAFVFCMKNKHGWRNEPKEEPRENPLHFLDF